MATIERDLSPARRDWAEAAFVCCASCNWYSHSSAFHPHCSVSFNNSSIPPHPVTGIPNRSSISHCQFLKSCIFGIGGSPKTSGETTARCFFLLDRQTLASEMGKTRTAISHSFFIRWTFIKLSPSSVVRYFCTLSRLKAAVQCRRDARQRSFEPAALLFCLSIFSSRRSLG